MPDRIYIAPNIFDLIYAKTNIRPDLAVKFFNNDCSQCSYEQDNIGDSRILKAKSELFRHINTYNQSTTMYLLTTMHDVPNGFDFAAIHPFFSKESFEGEEERMEIEWGHDKLKTEEHIFGSREAARKAYSVKKPVRSAYRR